MRDLVLKYIPKTPSMVYYHIISWSLFITYEISLSAAKTGEAPGYTLIGYDDLLS